MNTYEPDDELVEVAARAVFNTLSERPEDWRADDWEDGAYEEWLTVGRAVLRAVGPTLLGRGWDECYSTAYWDPGARYVSDPNNPYRVGGAS